MKQIAFVSDWELFGVDELAATPPRRAVLSVLLDNDGKVALFQTKREGEAGTFYQLPAGELTPGANAEVACPHIIHGRAGVPCTVAANLGVIIENRALNAFTQINYCFLTHLSGEKWRPDLSDSEKASGTRLEWLPLSEVIALLETDREDYNEKYVHYRDAALAKEVFQYLLDEKNAE